MTRRPTLANMQFDWLNKGILIFDRVLSKRVQGKFSELTKQLACNDPLYRILLLLSNGLVAGLIAKTIERLKITFTTNCKHEFLEKNYYYIDENSAKEFWPLMLTQNLSF